MHDVFTLNIRVFVPAPIPNGWAWAPWADQDPVGREELTSLAQLPRVLRTFARAVSLMILPRDADRFNVTAFGATSGAVYGRDQWFWDPEFRVFRPHGEPFAPRDSSVTQELRLTAACLDLPGRAAEPVTVWPAA